jgi:hypothetical protein
MAETKPQIETIKTIKLLGEPPDLTYKVTDYQGRPCLNMIFIGAGYPTVLKMGPGKVKMALFSTDEMQKFLLEHGGKLDRKD